MRGLDLDYMLGLVPVILGYVPLTLGMAAAGMVLALILASLPEQLRNAIDATKSRATRTTPVSSRCT